MPSGFDTFFALSLEPGQVVANLLVALLCGLLISVSYRLTSDDARHSPAFIRANVVLCMITALVIMVIGNNLARAFGLVGAMSIIRFRTAVKDILDIVYIFFALAAGMAAGVGLAAIALLGTICIGAVMVVLHRVRYAHPNGQQFIIQFHCRLPEGEAPYTRVFELYGKRITLVNMQSLGPQDLYEFSFHAELKDKGQREELLRALGAVPAISNIRFFFDE